MKKLILIGGTMGAGKSTVSEILLKLLDQSVYLDGDWCWKMNPFLATEEDREMVLQNISDLLRRFLNHSSLKYVVFCWVMHQEEIVKEILKRLDGCEYELFRFNLICEEGVLRERLKKDVEKGLRMPDVIERSVARLPLYRSLEGTPLDVSNISAIEVAQQIQKRIESEERNSGK